MKPHIEKILFVLLILFLAVVIFLLPFRLTVFNENFYYSQFEKNDVYNKVDEPRVVLDNLFDFFKGKESLDYFSENEKSHLKDVKVLFNNFFLILYFSLIFLIVSLIILFFVNKKEFKVNFFKIIFLSGLTSFVLLALLFFAAFNFSVTFDAFHKIFFPQGNYLFSASSLLIRLFPESFFFNISLRIFLSSLFLSIVCILSYFVFQKKK